MQNKYMDPSTHLFIKTAALVTTAVAVTKASSYCSQYVASTQAESNILVCDWCSYKDTPDVKHGDGMTLIPFTRHQPQWGFHCYQVTFCIIGDSSIIFSPVLIPPEENYEWSLLAGTLVLMHTAWIKMKNILLFYEWISCQMHNLRDLLFITVHYYSSTYTIRNGPVNMEVCNLISLLYYG